MPREDEVKMRIAETLRQMLKHNDIDEIHVTRLCEKARVSRRTFYNNFSDIYAVVPWTRREIMKESVCRIGREFTWHEGHERMFDLYVKRNMPCKENLSNYDGYLAVKAIILENILAKKPELTPDELIDLDFYVYAVAQIIRKWGFDGMKIPPRRMADLCQRYIPEWMIDLFGA